MEYVMKVLINKDIKNIIDKTCETLSREEGINLDGEYSNMLYRIFITNRDEGCTFELGFGVHQGRGGRDIYLDVRENKDASNQLIEQFIMGFIRALIEYEEGEIVYSFSISGIQNTKQLMESIGCEKVNEKENEKDNKYYLINKDQRKIMKLCLSFVENMKDYLGDGYFLSRINYDKTTLPLMEGAGISFDILYKGFQHRVMLENHLNEIIVGLNKNGREIFKQRLNEGDESCVIDYLVNLYEEETLHYLVEKPISEFSLMMRKMFNSQITEDLEDSDMVTLYKGFENELKKERNECDNPYIVVEYIQEILMKKIEDAIVMTFYGNNEVTYCYGVDTKCRAKEKMNSEMICWIKRGDVKTEIAKIKMI